MFLMILLMVDIIAFFQQVAALVRTYPYIYEFGPFVVVIKVYSLCRVQRGADADGDGLGDIIYFEYLTGGAPTSVVGWDGESRLDHLSDTEAAGLGTSYGGFPKCVEMPTAHEVIEAAATVPDTDHSNALTPDQVERVQEMINNNPDIELLLNSSGIEATAQTVNSISKHLTIPFSELWHEGDLIMFLLIRGVIVFVLTFLLERFLHETRNLASTLGGTEFAGRLGGAERPDGKPQAFQAESPNFMGLREGVQRLRQGTTSNNKSGARKTRIKCNAEKPYHRGLQVMV